MTGILVTKPRAVKQFLERLANGPSGVEPLCRRLDGWSDPSIGGHVQTPGDGRKGSDLFPKGVSPYLIVVTECSVAWPGKREGEVAIRLTGIAHERGVNLLHGMQRGRVGLQWNGVQRQDTG